MNSQLLGDNIQPAAYVIQPITSERTTREFAPYSEGCKPLKEDPIDRYRQQYAQFVRYHMPPNISLADSPMKSPKERKCRDIVCLIFFFVAWIAAIVLLFEEKMFYKAKEKTTAMMLSADSMRRICGQGGVDGQLDKLSTDFGRLIRTAAEAEQFCNDVTGIVGVTTTVQCANIIDNGALSATNSRKFFQDLRQWNEDQSANFAIQTVDSYVCAPRESDCQKLQNKAYACHGELKEIISKHYGANANYNDIIAELPYLSNTRYGELRARLLVDRPASEYLLRLCEPLGDAYKFNDFLKPFSGEYCEIDYSSKRGEFSKVGMIAYMQYYAQHIVGEFIGEIRVQYWWVIAGAASSLVIMIVYTLLLQFIAPVLIWGTVVLLFALMIWGQVEFYLAARSVKAQIEFIYAGFGYTDAELQKTYDCYFAFAVVLTIIEAILLVLVCIFFRAIRVASGVISASMSALRSSWYIFLLPVAFIVLAALHAGWSVSATYLYYTSGEYDARLNQFDFAYYEQLDGLYTLRRDAEKLCIYIYMIFICIWGFFIVYCSMEYLISAVVVQWYFTYYKGSIKGALSQAIRCLFKSFGTVLATSFITAVVCIIRWLFEYFLKRMEQSSKISNNKVVKAAIWFTRCCLKCLEKFVQWINRNVQIVAAVSGDGYCTSTRKAIKLVLGNLITSVGVKGLAKFFLFLGEVLVTVLGGVICYFCVTASKNPQMIVSPVILTVAISYVISFYVMHIIEIVIDSVYLCFQYERCFLMKDKESGSRSYAPKSLVSLL